MFCLLYFGVNFITSGNNTVSFLIRNPIFYHYTVNHSQNFVDPQTGAHTQHIERLWKELKKINRRYEGIPREQVHSHIAKFIRRNNEIINQGKDPFMAAVELIANTIFSPGLMNE